MSDLETYWQSKIGTTDDYFALLNNNLQVLAREYNFEYTTLDLRFPSPLLSVKLIDSVELGSVKFNAGDRIKLTELLSKILKDNRVQKTDYSYFMYALLSNDSLDISYSNLKNKDEFNDISEDQFHIVKKLMTAYKIYKPFMYRNGRCIVKDFGGPMSEGTLAGYYKIK